MQRRHGEDGNAETDAAANQRQDHRFRDELPDESRATRAERSANRQLVLAYRRAREQEVRDVDAGEEEHERYGAEQHIEQGAKLTKHLIGEWNDAQRESSVGRIDRG